MKAYVFRPFCVIFIVFVLQCTIALQFLQFQFLATPVACSNMSLSARLYYVQTYTPEQKSAQMLRDISRWLTINSMRAEKVGCFLRCFCV